MSAGATSINERVIRWSEMRLPHPSKPGELASWEFDGPFALRPYYRIEGEDSIVKIEHLDRRKEDGTLSGCIYCGSGSLQASRDVAWPPILLLALFGLGLAYWTYGISAVLVAYPVWFLWASSPRIQSCSDCGSQFVNFCEGPRP